MPPESFVAHRETIPKESSNIGKKNVELYGENFWKKLQNADNTEDEKGRNIVKLQMGFDSFSGKIVLEEAEHFVIFRINCLPDGKYSVVGVDFDPDDVIGQVAKDAIGSTAFELSRYFNTHGQEKK